MRPIHTLFAVVTLSSLVAGHIATPHRRAVDTCANINLSLSVLDVLSVGVKACACLGTTGALVKQNSSLYVASKVLGEANIASKVAAAIQGGQGRCECTYPDYAIPACSSNDLCHFDCPRDRVKVNGQCVSSKAPYTVHQISRGKNKRSGRGTPNWARRALSSAHCPVGTEMCGVIGRPDAWECLKIEEDLESCGGCAYPFFPGQEPGTDCSAIPGVEAVACRKGLCEVSKCVTNWTISTDGHACEPNEHAKGRQFISVGRANKASDADAVRMAS
ncbi:hypothetical protein BN14_00444 [Rhizoctonia solani AG-1 IB]|uniref:Protein CPL1-like domain-containing protein n=1 Tax=Thanatephorus cucumeris (strain AG1-IB / isolate 7/3/14) TaxID=1108050 RepID=M5BIQ5_THACB|nr:hypothetical protein BN14_00444 [Rhizoctonia solani AG-1 IB]